MLSYEYILIFLTLLIANLIPLFIIKGRFVYKYLFLTFFSIAYLFYLLDPFKLYYSIQANYSIVLNVLYYLILSILLIASDLIFNKNKKFNFKENNDTQFTIIVLISKTIIIIDFLITVYFLTNLMDIKNTSIVNLYMKHPYFLEVNFVQNSILGNILKLNIFNLVLMVALKLNKVKYKGFYIYLFLSILILIAPNAKGNYIISALAIIHLIFLYRRVDWKLIFKSIFMVSLMAIGTFYSTYSLYITAGVELNIIRKLYTYITSPIVGAHYLEHNQITSIFEMKTIRNLLDKLNLLESNDILKNNEFIVLNGNIFGNVKGLFGASYDDLGFIGPIIFIFMIVIFINFLEINLNKSIFNKVLFVIIISFLDLAFFGNYFSNTIFIEMLASFFVFVVLYKTALIFKYRSKRKD